MIHSKKAFHLPGWVGAAIAIALAGAGCASNTPPYARRPNGSSFTAATAEGYAAARAQAFAAADTYVNIVVQAAEELHDSTKREEVAEWALSHRTAVGIASFTNATAPNAYVALLDMMVLSNLKRRAVEEHWIPTLLHDEGKPLLESYKRGEQQVWEMGAKVLDEAQIAELRAAIEQWRTANPTQYYVSHIRFTDFANAMGLTARSPAAGKPGSVFGLLYLDPLAGLDPVAQELQQYRALTERLIYLANRLPVFLIWRADLSVHRALRDPRVVRFVDNTGRFADATTRFTAAVEKYPRDLTTERMAAIDQLDTATTRQVKSALDQAFAGIAEQREALTQEIESQQSSLRSTLADVRGIVDRAEEAGRSLNQSAGQTIGTAEMSSRRTLNHAFQLGVAFVAVTLLAMLLYRIVIKRWALRGEPPRR